MPRAFVLIPRVPQANDESHFSPPSIKELNPERLLDFNRRKTEHIAAAIY
jgi:hypothetical protein